VHSTYFDGVQIMPEKKGTNSATIQYVGFSRSHRVMGFVIIGFFKKALEISGAKKVDAHFTFPSKQERNSASWHCSGIEGNAGLITIRLGHNGARVAVPKSDFRAGILHRNRRKPAARTFQVLKAFQLKVPAVGVANQDFIDSIGNNLSTHDTASRQVVSPRSESFQSVRFAVALWGSETATYFLASRHAEPTALAAGHGETKSYMATLFQKDSPACTVNQTLVPGSGQSPFFVEENHVLSG